MMDGLVFLHMQEFFLAGPAVILQQEEEAESGEKDEEPQLPNL